MHKRVRVIHLQTARNEPKVTSYEIDNLVAES